MTKYFLHIFKFHQFPIIPIAIASLFEDVTPQLGCLNAAALFHNTLLHSVLRAPAEFFDTIPCGRILARFSGDIEVMDSSLPRLMSDSVYFVFGVNIFSVQGKSDKRPFFLPNSAGGAIWRHFMENSVKKQ